MPDDTGYGLLRGILEDPIDDAPRLVFADWLDETGEPPDALLAEVIRLEVWLARADRRAADPGLSAAETAEYDRHLRRLADVWWAHSYRWFRDTDRADVDRGFLRAVRTDLRAFPDRAEAIFRRHPITEVHFHDAGVDLEGDELVVRVTADWRHGNIGRAVRRGCWPLDLFPGEEGREFRFRTFEAAAEVLSAAAVAYGRRAADLPVLDSGR